jgi:ABC-2 type transport system permease protein
MTTTVPAVGPRAPFVGVALGLATRSLVRIRRIPAAIIPTVAMPIFLLLAFSGSFSAVTDLPNFPTDNMLNWVLPYAVLQGAAFAGVGAAQAVAADLENGFYDRLLMSPASRWSLMAGPVAAAAIRALLPLVTVTSVAVIGGASFEGGILGLLILVLAAEGFAVVGTFWGLGVVYRLRTQRSGALISVGVFVAMFLSIGQVPLSVMQGWLHSVARVNPITNLLRMSRQGLIGEVTWADTWPGLLVIAVGTIGFGLFAATGMRHLDE